VAYVLAAYNTTKHSATGYFPNMLVYWRELRFPNELMYTDIEENDKTVMSSIDFLTEKQELFKRSFAAAREMLGNTAERSKRRYDMRVKTTVYAQRTPLGIGCISFGRGIVSAVLPNGRGFIADCFSGRETRCGKP